MAQPTILSPNTDIPDWRGYILERYILFAVLAAVIWDFLLASRDEITILQLRKHTWPLVTHYVSRVSTAAFVACGIALGTVSLAHCANLRDAIGICFVLAQTSTALLFLHRVRAIFFGHTSIITCFFFLWLGIVGTSIVVPIFVDATTRLGPGTQYCDVEFQTHALFAPLCAVVVSAVYYTTVFVAVSWKLVSGMSLTTLPDNGSKGSLCFRRFRTFFHADDLPKLTRTLFRGGQKYYLHTVGLDVLIVCVVSRGFSSFSYTNIMFGILFIEVSLQNVFACRLFRDTLLELSGSRRNEDDADTFSVALAFAPDIRLSSLPADSEGRTDSGRTHNVAV